MKEELTFIVLYKFNKNDYKQLNIKSLYKYFNVKFLDVSEIFLKKSINKYYKIQSQEKKIKNYQIIKKYTQLYKELFNCKLIFDWNHVFLNLTKKSILEKIIKKKELKFVTLLTSSTPNFFNHSILGKVFYLRNFLYLLFKFKKSKIFLFYRNSFFLLFRRKQHKLLFNDFDYILVFDDLIKKYSLEAFPKSKLIYTHHKDYETYLSYKNKKKIIKKQYAVLLDENIFNHPDNFQWNKYYNKNNFSYYQEQYYELLNKFLLNFEKISKLEVVVAGHPKNFDNANNRKFYGNRKFVINKTFDLIKDCKIVLAHSSMSVSFAILLKKPIVFLNSSLMFKLGMFTKVLSLVVETNAPMLYMEDQLLDYKYLLNNKKILYKSYTNKFLKSSMSNKNKSIWRSLFEALTL